jgi:hypothetical protein
VLSLTADSYRPVAGAFAVGAVLLLAIALAWPLPSFLPWPLVVLGGVYAWKLGGDRVDQWAPLYAGGLLAVAELAYWSVQTRGRAQDAEGLTERRVGLIATLAVLAVAAGGLILAATSLRVGSGVVVDLLGVAAAVGALAVVATLARPHH